MTSDVDKMRLSMMTMIEGLGAMTEAIVGFRAQLEAAGYSPTMAEMLAGELHRQMIISVFAKGRDG